MTYPWFVRGMGGRTVSEKINVKQAVDIASEFAQQIYGSEDAALEGIRVETVEYVESSNKWFITLGWNDAAYKEIPSAEMAGIKSKAPRTFKVFHIDAEKGEVVKMEARDKQ